MLTAEAAAWEIPAPDPVLPVVIETFGYFALYAGAHRFISGYSSVAPVSDNATFDVAGEVAGLPAVAPVPAGPPVEVDPQAAAASIIGTATTRAANGEYKRFF